MICISLYTVSEFSPHVALRYKFDDERVTKEDAKKALEEQYGGDEEVSSICFFLFKDKFCEVYLIYLSPSSMFLFWIKQLPQINPGFNNAPFKFTKYSNAYMLVYIRESAKEKIMCTVDEKDIAEHLRVCTICSILSVFTVDSIFWCILVENCGFV
jgi:ubiquitin carboxyl-terminal hydrolase 7